MKKKRKRGKRGKVPAHLRRYLFKKKHKTRKKRSKSMAKKKRKTARRRRSTSRRAPRRRRRGGGGGGYGIMPSKEDMKMMAMSGAYGYLEGAAKKDQNHFMWKVPKPIDQLGFAGNTAVVAFVASHFFKNPWLRLFARATANIATYQMGRKGALFTQSGEIFTIAGYTDEDVRVMLENSIGALQADGAEMSGVEWDPEVNAALQHT